jgi:hypothetical protein
MYFCAADLNDSDGARLNSMRNQIIDDIAAFYENLSSIRFIF